jgi:hypothetical protein
MTIITNINALPTSPYAGTGLVAIVITSGVPSFFQVLGTGLTDIASVHWYPENPSSVQFETRQMILVDDTEGTFMIRVTNNYLDINDRAGKISFQMNDGSTWSAPVVTYGPVAKGPLWQSPQQGLVTGLD